MKNIRCFCLCNPEGRAKPEIEANLERRNFLKPSAVRQWNEFSRIDSEFPIFGGIQADT